MKPADIAAPIQLQNCITAQIAHSQNPWFLNSAIASAAAILLALGVSIYPQEAAAQETYTDRVLGWTAEQQSGLIGSSMTMAALIYAQNKETARIATCLEKWYGFGDGLVAQRNAEILEIMRQRRQFHPQAIILGVIKRECGPLP